jgi:hypothetical protein
VFTPNPGDIYKVELKENKVKYFQFFSKDKLRYNSDIIIVYKNIYDLKEDVDFSELTNKNNINFISHTSITTGLRLKEWTKATNYKLPDKLTPKFRTAKNYKEDLKSSNEWYTWSPQDLKYEYVSNSRNKLNNSYVGIVFSPYQIVKLMRTHKNNFDYPQII